MKKRLSMILTTGICFLISGTVFAASTFTDIDQSYAKQQIITLHQDGYIDGYDNKNGTYSFKPTQNINRQEFAKMLVKAVGLEENPAACTFTDVDDWAKGYVGALYEANITEGISATQFGSKNNLTREQMATFFVRAMGMEERASKLRIPLTFVDRWDISDYAYKNIAFAQQIGLINGVGDGKFEPLAHTQRQAVARLVYELIYHFEDKYVPAILLLENKTAVEANVNDDGTYTVVYPASNGAFTEDRMTFTLEEFEKGLNVVYEAYHNVIMAPMGKQEWADLPAEQKAMLVQLVVVTWSLEHSPNVLPEAVVASEENMTKFMQKLYAEIDAFFNDPANAEAKLYESKLTELVNSAYAKMDIGTEPGSQPEPGQNPTLPLLGNLLPILDDILGLLTGLLK
jgi:hypothetical protein